MDVDAALQGPAVYGPGAATLAPLTAQQVARLLGEGTTLVDARRVASFGAGHIPGAISIPLRPAFATWLGWLTDPDRPAAFVLEPGQDRADLVRQARGIGYEHLAGALAGGMPAWQAAHLPVQHIDVILTAEVTGTVLDVRQAAEYQAGHLPGALHIELGALAEQAAQLDGEPLTVMCGQGERAMTAASLLTRDGHEDVAVAIGGPDDWAAAHGRPLGTSP